MPLCSERKTSVKQQNLKLAILLITNLPTFDELNEME